MVPGLWGAAKNLDFYVEMFPVLWMDTLDWKSKNVIRL